MQTLQEKLTLLEEKLSKSLLTKDSNEMFRVLILFEVPEDLVNSFVDKLPKDYNNRTEWRNAQQLAISTHYFEWRHKMLQLARDHKLEAEAYGISGKIIQATCLLPNLLDFCLEAPIKIVQNWEDLEKIQGMLCGPDENGNM